MRSNQWVASTNDQGVALIPGLLPYQSNDLSLDPVDLPMDTTLATAKEQAYPYARSGMLLNFVVHRSRNALLVLRQADGAVLPVGAQVLPQGAAQSFVVAKRGEVYLTDLQAQQLLQVRWPGHHCAVQLNLPVAPANDPVADLRLGPLTCQETS